MGDDVVMSTELRRYAALRGNVQKEPCTERKTFDLTTFLKIARLAKIPRGKQSGYRGFAINLRAAMALAWEGSRTEGDEPKRNAEPVYQRDAVHELKKRMQAIKAVRSLLYSKPNNAASEHAQRHVRMFLSQTEKDALLEFDNVFNYALNRYDEAISRATSLVMSEYNTRGRPAGIGGIAGNVAADMFAKQLHYAAKTNGGHLRYSYSKGSRIARGTLCAVLDLLRAYLPAGFLPANEAKHFWESTAAEAARDLADENRPKSG